MKFCATLCDSESSELQVLGCWFSISIYSEYVIKMLYYKYMLYVYKQNTVVVVTRSNLDDGVDILRLSASGTWPTCAAPPNSFAAL